MCKQYLQTCIYSKIKKACTYNQGIARAASLAPRELRAMAFGPRRYGCSNVDVYIYIYMQREREIDRQIDILYIYIYIYTHTYVAGPGLPQRRRPSQSPSRSCRVYHIISYYIISYHIILYYTISYHIMLCYSTLVYIISYYSSLYHDKSDYIIFLSRSRSSSPARCRRRSRQSQGPTCYQIIQSMSQNVNTIRMLKQYA